MFCPNCVKIIKDGSNFCKYCGCSIQDTVENGEQKGLVNSESGYNGAWKKADSSKVGVAIVAVVFLVMMVVVFTSSDKITEKELYNLIPYVTTTSIGGVERSFAVDKLIITSRSEGYEDSIIVDCDVTMSNDMMTADVEYRVDCKKLNDNWEILDSQVIGVDDVKPKQGAVAAESGDLVEDAIKALYPDINWGYQQLDLLGNDIDYDFEINWKINETDTDLKNGKDHIVCGYSFDTHTVTVEGELEIDYEFTKDGTWVMTGSNQIQDEIEWDLNGLWSFDIYTYYVDVEFLEIDFGNDVAAIRRRGSALQGSGTMETIAIGFTEEENCLYFDTFIIPGSSWGSEHEITLTAKLDDLYYKCPNFFSGAAPYDEGIGGKN